MSSSPSNYDCILSSIDDIFHGKKILPDQLPCHELTFRQMLEKSLLHWTQNKVRGVWLTIPSEKANFIPIAIEHKFTFHHANSHYLILTRWLPQNEENKLPKYAFTRVGVGGFVLNDKNELLVVQEKYSTNTAYWKLPGGLAEAGESLVESAIREVFEETKIHTEFVSIIGFRHSSPIDAECTDLYFVVRLKPTSYSISIDTSELADAKWMPLEEYLAHPLVSPFNRQMARISAQRVSNGNVKSELIPTKFQNSTENNGIQIYLNHFC